MREWIDKEETLNYCLTYLLTYRKKIKIGRNVQLLGGLVFSIACLVTLLLGFDYMIPMCLFIMAIINHVIMYLLFFRYEDVTTEFILLTDAEELCYLSRMVELSEIFNTTSKSKFRTFSYIDAMINSFLFQENNLTDKVRNRNSDHPAIAWANFFDQLIQGGGVSEFRYHKLIGSMQESDYFIESKKELIKGLYLLLDEKPKDALTCFHNCSEGTTLVRAVAMYLSAQCYISLEDKDEAKRLLLEVIELTSKYWLSKRAQTVLDTVVKG